MSHDDTNRDLLLRGARVIDPSQGLDQVSDVLFSKGVVAKIGVDPPG